jgi:hypothetical protein
LYNGNGGVLKYENQKNLLAGDIYDRISSRTKLPFNISAVASDINARTTTSLEPVWENNLSVTLNVLTGDLVLVFSEGFFWVDQGVRMYVEINAYSGLVENIFVTDLQTNKTAAVTKDISMGIFKAEANGEVDFRHKWYLATEATGYCVNRTMVAFTIGQVV